MLFDLVDFLQSRRRLLFVVAFISIDFLLLTFCTQTLQAHRASIATHIRNSEIASRQTQYQADAFSSSYNIDQFVAGVEANTLRFVVATTDGYNRGRQDVGSAIRTGLRATGNGIVATIRAIGSAIGFVGRTIGNAFMAVVRSVGAALRFICRMELFPYMVAGHTIQHLFNGVHVLPNDGLAAVIHPANQNDDIPIITKEQAQQATLIQANTLAVKSTTPAAPTAAGSGGACDSGAGNGGYPMVWCDARMDSIETIVYSNDPINRECTSYAFWYFTTIEGHTDFHVLGNANRWAYTSNYPVHATPAVGSIAVETAGYYGHVAIVQALPGQTHNGSMVPDGYVLVSEMNYDWRGHFRYSYSPLSKFSAYIYP